MSPRSLAHLSDLHLGRSPEAAGAAVSLCRTLVRNAVDHVVVTGDVTNRGRRDELALFDRIFAPLAAEGRLTLVPGNHDRLGDDVGPSIMQASRVDVVSRPGLYIVRVDSTGPHNRRFLSAHGEIGEAVLDELEAALAAAPTRALVVVLLHHHPLALPSENVLEHVSNFLRLPNAAELRLGKALVRLCHGRSDLILHGHRHLPRSSAIVEPGRRALGIYNAGSSTELESARVFLHRDGALVGAPRWLACGDEVVSVSTPRCHAPPPILSAVS